MATGIRVDGDGNNFGDSLVFTDGDGIVVKGNNNQFPNARVFCTSEGLAKLIALLHLPENTPTVYLKEVVEAFNGNAEVRTSDNFKLKTWLLNNGFDLAYWTQCLQSLAPILIAGGAG